jgi:hypothetical protein
MMASRVSQSIISSVCAGVIPTESFKSPKLLPVVRALSVVTSLHSGEIASLLLVFI